MSFTPLEKVRIRKHLGYPELNALTALHAGVPFQQQTGFILESNMDHVLPQAEGEVRSIIGTLDKIDCQLREATDFLIAEKLGDMSLRENHPDLLEREYVRWAQRLSDILGAPLYPFAARFRTAGGVMAGSIPVKR